MKFIATATRRNVDNKPDYRWVYSHTNGTPVLFDSIKQAFDCAANQCADPAHGLYAPKSEKAPSTQ